jgi:glycosyltransferase involved in cell wall biosynthesis
MKSDMQRVLLITHCYPPNPYIGGLRPRGLAKYLPLYGWEVIVLTPRVSEGKRPGARVIETEDRDVVQDFKARFGLNPRLGLHDQVHLPLSSKPNTKLLHTRFIDWLKGWLEYPDSAKGWIPFALEAVSHFAKREQVDAILTTSPPGSSHIIGAQAKQLLQCPWIADFRDLWTQNLARRNHVSQRLGVRLEKKTLEFADALVTVSGPWATRLGERYRAKPIYTITNGFDPDDFQPRPQRLTKFFSITYAGYLYQGKRDPSIFLEVLAELIRERVLLSTEVRVRFFGEVEPWLTALISRYGLEAVVELHGVISREEVLQREMESQILLLLGWSDPKETGQHTGKLFEYLGAARPILAVGGTSGVMPELLNETKAGIHALTRQQLRDCLIAMYREFKNDGAVRYCPDNRAIEQYSHRQMARRFASVLNLSTGREKTLTGAYSAPECANSSATAADWTASGTD